MTANAGRGYVDSNSSQTSNNYTYADGAVACDADGMVTKIIAKLVVNNGVFEVGCGWIVDTTFYMRNYVTIDSSGKGTGLVEFNAPADFTSFAMNAGDWIVFYCNQTTHVSIDRTNTNGAIRRYQPCTTLGNKMADASFEIEIKTTRSIEFEFQGTGFGWSTADIDEQDPSNIDEFDEQSLADIETLDDL